MAYSASSIPSDHGEFSGGPGMIDPERRADRVLEPHEELWEAYATNPASTEDPQEVPVPRTLTGLL